MEPGLAFIGGLSLANLGAILVFMLKNENRLTKLETKMDAVIGRRKTDREYHEKD